MPSHVGLSCPPTGDTIYSQSYPINLFLHVMMSSYSTWTLLDFSCLSFLPTLPLLHFIFSTSCYAAKNVDCLSLMRVTKYSHTHTKPQWLCRVNCFRSCIEKAKNTRACVAERLTYFEMSQRARALGGHTLLTVGERFTVSFRRGACLLRETLCKFMWHKYLW